jgi:subtilisin family serine protease
MRSLRKWLVAVVAFAVAAGTSAAAPGASAPGEAGPARSAAPGQTVTLLTGDRLDVRPAPGGGYAVQPRPSSGDRAGMLFLQRRSAGRQLVIPIDAAPLIAAGKLDERLFDIGTLLDSGLADGSAKQLPLLLDYDKPASARAIRSALPAGTTVVRDLRSVGVLAVRRDKAKLGSFWRHVLRTPGVQKIWLDGGVQPALDRSVRQVGAPAAWRHGLTGRGVKVAVLDSGYDKAHPDLAGAVVAAENFSEDPDTTDRAGHGTHVASTIAGRGVASGGRYKGVAPDAELLIGKVCGRGCAISSIIAGMEWAASQGATVVNLSLGGGPSDGTDPLSQAIDEISARTGTLFVVSAGNFGERGEQTVTSPAAADQAFAVGSVTKADELSTFSSRGPRYGDHALKPDLAAPGDRIVAARAAGTLEPVAVDGSYAELSGTSMAAPHVAGAAAILAQQHPNWTADQLRSALSGSAEVLDGLSVYEQGAGRLSIARAVAQPVTAAPAKLDLGRAAWPHNDDEPIRQVVTYRNSGDRPVRLRLDLAVTGPNGRPAPGGLFGIDRRQVVVPAGGEARVAVTANPSSSSPDGVYGGWLTARGGSTVVRTPIGLDKEVPSYDNTVRMLDRQGRPAGTADGQFAYVFLTEVRTGLEYWLEPQDGVAQIRVPKGEYVVDGLIGIPNAADTAYGEGVLFVEPAVVLDGGELVLDGRLAEPVETKAPVAGASATTGGIGFARPVRDGEDVLVTGVGGSNSIVPDKPLELYAVPTRTGTRENFTGFAHLAWARMAEDPSPYERYYLDSPYLYHDVAVWPGRIPPRPSLVTASRDYARVNASYASASAVGEPAPRGVKWGYPFISAPGNPEQLVSAFVLSATVEMTLPFERAEYYAVGGGNVCWAFGFQGYEQSVDSPVTAYRPGRAVSERWNGAVFGPSLPEQKVGHPGTFTDAPWAFRDGDTVSLAVPLFADSGPGRAGFGVHSSERTALYRSGRLVASTDSQYLQTFRLPASAAEYRLSKVVRRSGVPLSTEVSSDWTFTSARTADGSQRALDLLAVRYAPKLDAHNAALGGRTFSIPVSVERQAGARPAPVRRLLVDVSYDDGATWEPAVVRRSGAGWTASVTHPPRGYVSLRATATAADGAAVRQTILRAYRLR